MAPTLMDSLSSSKSSGRKIILLDAEPPEESAAGRV
jgi:hypothetical protein